MSIPDPLAANAAFHVVHAISMTPELPLVPTQQESIDVDDTKLESVLAEYPAEDQQAVLDFFEQANAVRLDQRKL